VKLETPQPDQSYIRAAEEWLVQPNPYTGEPPPEAGAQRLMHWHQCYLPCDAGVSAPQDHPAQLGLEGWGCIVETNGVPSGCLVLDVPKAGASPRVNGYIGRDAVIRWLEALSTASLASHPQVKPSGTFVPSLLRVPGALASGLLLQPADESSGSLTLVVPIMIAARPSRAPLQPLDEFLSACSKALPPVPPEADLNTP
jgi:hypothetical protein